MAPDNKISIGRQSYANARGSIMGFNSNPCSYVSDLDLPFDPGKLTETDAGSSETDASSETLPEMK